MMNKLLLFALFYGIGATFAQSITVQCHTVCVAAGNGKNELPVFVNAVPYGKYNVVDSVTMNGNTSFDGVYAMINRRVITKLHGSCDAAIVLRLLNQPYLITWIKFKSK
jgi:hypothetical protein